MLYNKDWNKPKAVPTTDPMSMDGLIAWLETKDPSQKYHFSNPSRCMLAQWVRSIDPNAYNVSYPNNSYVYQVHGQNVNFQYTSFSRVAAADGDTFGGALEKAKSYRGRK